MQSYEFIQVRDTNATRWLEFARPPVNAFTQQMVEEVHDALNRALQDPSVRVVVLASSVDRYFSAGADLNVFKGMRSDGMRGWVTLCHEIADLMRSSPKPLLAAIHGTAVGGGLELTLHCDVRFASDTARLGQPEIQIAFIPPIATTQALVRLIGRPRAIQYLYSGQMISAAQALDWGLVDELVGLADLRTHVQAYAENLSTKSATALAAIRQTITLGGGLTFDEGKALEMEMAVRLADTPDFEEGISAFLEKRSPTWS